MGLIPDLAARRAQLTPDALAFRDHETGDAWSFARVDAAAARLGAALLARVPRGARVAILCHNRPEFFVALFACQKAGLILAPLNWRQPVAELKPVLGSVNCTLVLHDETFAEPAAALGVPVMALEIPDGPALDPVQVDDEQPWYVLFTSGTTGTPKAVIQTPRMVVANAMNIAQAMGLVAEDRTLNFLPLFHTGGINLFTLPIFLWGGSSLVLRKFDAQALVALISQGAVTQFFGVPAIYQALMHMDLSGIDLSRLRGWACGGAALPEATIRFFADRGAVICNGFGMTETGPTGFLIDRAAAITRIGSVGKPQMMTEARLDGVADGQPGAGELLLRGPTVTPGYLDNPGATAASFTVDGWLKSGDVAERDSDGYYRIIDRIKDMYISGGENVYPAEVEKVLITHPSVLDAAVIGVSDATWGESGVAFLIARPGHPVDPCALTGWLRERLAGYKLPKAFHVVTDFPRTAAGKVRKPELRKLVP
ncbi:class I adenylate-forming enzyme family protein [Pararhodobacter zhoushanensis]|uniref:AMP-binding protein n=1 Tax=Pararhodobacter zhoushanensis TaxID=2479545 RepID=A0ABT3GTZ2_9RHOB|nr:AMP-binding protein [Pararhodobacter zhoushanensis]MCW1930969.1 AMP-binding protein [Pararhodobacter zhoushanensis]